ncbi:SDR family NAD(P)-dependent oxidoreductase [Vibrio algarum]|uniref:SDR family NAD(P)-dependent oxidoreductase n=1 Tax=Vibrio algarum TaxID=3020714 RepID=A0ABT4YVS3_9VIBR|nr:SDR family NAD(P)-dependent oxidoreductase [Vibrio sp. KJ40-1]MDB1125114.1 SDR family NAD(P)-dependent oxidoreductase [Vibrio sp. KJ40-1]
MFNDLKNRNILITGSTSGIGLSAAKFLASSGAHVSLTSYRHHEEIAETIETINNLGGSASFHQVDFCNDEACETFVEDFVRERGGIDVLVNNVGGLVERRQTEEIDAELFDNVAYLNMRSAHTMVRLCLPYLKESAKQNNWSASVISVGSIAAYSGGGPGASLYAASKAWLHTINRSWAKNHATDNIRFNVIAPGTVDTAFHADKNEEAKARMSKGIPMGRLGTSDEMAPTFAYLASHLMSGYVTGQILHVNGGQFMS